jgi:serine/threonine protein kinase
MSESALNKSTMISQFKEYYDRSQSLLLENPKYLHLNIHNYVGKYNKECSSTSIHKQIIDFGSYGEIYECCVNRLNLIVKRIPVKYPFNKQTSKYNVGKNKHIESGEFYNEHIDPFLNEILINIILQTENSYLFCRLLGFNFKEDTENKEVLGYFFIIMEHCGYKINRDVSLADLLDWFIEIAQAIQIMHNKNIIHNDIASRNILISNSHILIIDFGMSEITDDTDNFKNDIYLFYKMVLDEIKYITGSDDLGPFTPLESLLSNIDNRDLYPSIEYIISILLSLKHTFLLK